MLENTIIRLISVIACGVDYVGTIGIKRNCQFSIYRDLFSPICHWSDILQTDIHPANKLTPLVEPASLSLSA